MTLASHGWVGWDTAQDLTRGATALWLEPTGYRLGPLPPRQPTTTRIHAWLGQRCWRILPGADQVLVTELLDAGSTPPPGTRTRSAEATTSEIAPWAAPHIGALPDDLPPLTRLEVTAAAESGTMARISFLRRQTPAGPAPEQPPVPPPDPARRR
jgi:hypothetical protein